MGNTTFLVIEKGEPFESGSIVTLKAHQTLFGRNWENHLVDISFSSLYISKKHATLDLYDNKFFITDVGSKHGTFVNGQDIGQLQPYQLKDGDKVSLAKGTVDFSFHDGREVITGETIEFTNFSPGKDLNLNKSLVINLERREVLINGQPMKLVGKDLDLLLLLYANLGKAVSYQDIKLNVWPERVFAGGIPDVGNEEITVLVYRLRKRLGPLGDAILALPRFGYMLDLS